ncbi:MAG: hypothetical protein AB8B97_24220 [Granulosicoccus sp.]
MQQSSAVTRHAIAVSYLASLFAGATLFDIDWNLIAEGWFWAAALEGICFYIVFRMIALTTEHAGIAATSIATKMSVVIPTLIGIFALGETVNFLKATGLFFGALSVFLIVGWRFRVSNWALPLLVFLCTGLIDASFKLFQVWGLSASQFPGFIVTIFGFAFIASATHHMLLPDKRINHVSVLSGMALGLANLGTVYFMLKALAQPEWESSIIYPLNNVGVVLLSTVVAVVIFKERLLPSTISSLMCATVSIALLYAAR